jgi:thiol-disulfide isomerase/thioredoxin
MTEDEVQSRILNSEGHSRRTWLMVGAGVGAAAAGASLAWWRLQPAMPVDGAVEALLGSTFETPQGQALNLAQFRGKPLLVNFWATWCPPCVEELPLLNSFYQQNSVNGWNVLGLAIDQPSAVRAFLQKLPLGFPVGMAGLGGTELSKSLGNLTGGLPFTVALRADGGIIQRKMGRVTEGDLALWRKA